MRGPNEENESDERSAWDDSLTDAYLNGVETAERGEDLESAAEHAFDPREDDN